MRVRSVPSQTGDSLILVPPNRAHEPDVLETGLAVQRVRHGEVVVQDMPLGADGPGGLVHRPKERDRGLLGIEATRIAASNGEIERVAAPVELAAPVIR